MKKTSMIEYNFRKVEGKSGVEVTAIKKMRDGREAIVSMHDFMASSLTKKHKIELAKILSKLDV